MAGQLLSYKIVGKGYPVVFLHGFLESISMWDYLKLEKMNFQSILIDLPGHGDSLNEDEDVPSIEYMAFKVKEVLIHLNINDFSVVGHSMGGYVSLVLKNELNISSSRFILNCSKVVLLNSNFWEDSEDKKRDRLRILNIIFLNKELFIQTAIPGLFSEKTKFENEIKILTNEAIKLDAHSISYASLAMRNRKNYKNVLETFSKDFLILQGEIDNISPLEIMISSLSEINVRLVVIKKVGHMAHIEDSQKVIYELSSFLC